MVGTAQSPKARAAGGGFGTGSKQRDSRRAPSGALENGEVLALLLQLVTAVAPIATALEKALEPLVGRKAGGNGKAAREGGAAGGGPRPPCGAGKLPSGDAPSAAAKAARSSPSRRARNARRAKAHRSVKKGGRRVGDGEPAPRPPAEEEAGLPPPPPPAAPPGETAAPPAAPGEPPATAAQAAAPTTTTTISTAGAGKPAVRFKRARARSAEQPRLPRARPGSLPNPPVLHRPPARPRARRADAG